MANTAALSISITAITRGLTAGLRSAQKSIANFGRNVGKSFGGKGGLVSAIGGLGLGAGLVALTKQSFDHIDATTELASRLGVSVEFLSGLQHSAELAGASTEQLAKGFQFFNKTLGEATSGNTAAQTSFTQLGLDFRDLAAQGPEKSFLLTADAIGRLSTASERAAAAQSIFSRGGTSLLDVFAQGRAGIEGQIEEARSLGRAFTEIDAAKVGAADNALVRARGAAQGLANVLSVEAAPAIALLANKFVEFASGVVSQRNTIIETFQSSALSVAQFVDVLSLATSVAFVVAATVSRIGQAFAAVVAIPAEIGGAISNVFRSLFGLGEAGESSALKIAKAFDATATVLEKKSENAFTEFSQGTAAQNVVSFFDELKRSSADVGNNIVNTANDAQRTNLLSEEGARNSLMRGSDVGRALQIDLERTAIGADKATGRVQEVRSPQIDQTNVLLQQLLTAINKGGFLT